MLIEGTVIFVPNGYASKTLLFIDVVSNLPVSIKTFDNEGLYESYEFSNTKAIKVAIIGAIAANAAFGIAKLISG